MTQSINKSDDELFESDDEVFQNDDETESLEKFEQLLLLIPNPNVKTAHCVIVDNDDNIIQRCTGPEERYLRQLSGAWEIDSQAVKDVKRDISALRICLRHLNFDQRTVHEFESKKEQSTNKIRGLAYVKDHEVRTQKKRMLAADPRLRINLNPNVINIAAIDNIDLKDATFQYGKAPSKDEHVHKAVDMFLEDFGYTEDGVLNLLMPFAPLFHITRKYRYAESVARFITELQNELQLLQNLQTVPSINLTQEGHYFAFDEALETFGIKFLKENMTGCATNLENLELNIKAAQTEYVRLNLLISEFTNDQSVSRSSRSIKSCQEVL
ncbi:hypothetical protein C2G38_2048881 [Gigaspora rosea]|uniref:Uncharacterized protein n=1 Tax=Gigaspora rosea TaxID=44941 RepID=A0A397U0X5_9GLOM|nr:hypothetical protein C2G38_2048881 [Gigaspora rosea]